MTNTTTAPTVDRIRQILTEAAGWLGMPYDHDADAAWSAAVLALEVAPQAAEAEMTAPTDPVRLIRTMIPGWYIVEVAGTRIGEVEQCRSPLWRGARWAGRLYDFPTRFNCDSRGHSTRDGALDEMMRFWTELENSTRGME